MAKWEILITETVGHSLIIECPPDKFPNDNCRKRVLEAFEDFLSNRPTTSRFDLNSARKNRSEDVMYFEARWDRGKKK